MTTEQCYMLGGVLKAQESDHVTDNSTRLPSDGADRVLKEGKVLGITKDKQNDELEEIRGVLGREALRALEQRTHGQDDGFAVLQGTSKRAAYAPVAVRQVLVKHEVVHHLLAGDRDVVVLDAVEANAVVALRQKRQERRARLDGVGSHERENDRSQRLTRMNPARDAYDRATSFSRMSESMEGNTRSMKHEEETMSFSHVSWAASWSRTESEDWRSRASSASRRASQNTSVPTTEWTVCSTDSAASSTKGERVWRHLAKRLRRKEA